ncbi:hypothetical protein [Paenibacillus ehimensis]|uniref:Uncharacterized protein n=1 Tax=Paenibacillus ehimensis TaxID=79264 RepID=A0ABT8V9B8_9BACL|nr:hypothetical protein [Paenibacillus ehimensis]MDO3676716.1 hypothetical protein [Paenibacillus ehimensis]
MFDTIIMKTCPVYPNLESVAAEKIAYLDKGTTYKIKDSQIPYIKYYDNSRTLVLQVSIPKFLYGNNVTILQEKDIPLFFQRLHERLYELFQIEMKTEDWSGTERLDVCWNFQVGHLVSDYVREIHKLKLPYMKPYSYGHLETAGHKNDSRETIFYNKQLECIDRKEPKEIIDQAHGILRMEIRPSYKEMKKFSPKRHAVELLTKEFFIQMTEAALKPIQFTEAIEGIPFSWLKSQHYDIRQIESVLGFKLLQSQFTETELKQLYKSGTYDNRRGLARRITFPSQTKLAPLKIDYANLG